MALVPADWNVVVVGYWNSAILTPKGIARRLFELPDEVPIEVEVPLDAPAPFRVRHAGMTIMAGGGRLIVEPTALTYGSLADAMKLGSRALDSLPQTPVLAAGYNIRYKSSEVPLAVVEVVEHSWDNLLSDEALDIEARAIMRSLKWRGGNIKFTVSQDPNLSFSVLLNFERQSNDATVLRDWLEIPIEDVRSQAERMLFRCLGLSQGDFGDVDPA